MLHNILSNYELVLASASPRRRDIFQMLGLNPLQISPQIDEPLDNRKPYQIVQSHALHKAQSIVKNFDSSSIIVAADTLVEINSRILPKPLNKDEAAEYLTLLSNDTHNVYSGVCILHKNASLVRYARSKVIFKPLSKQEISAYLKTGEPFDKAGAYGIQGYGSQFIKEIRGCYFNVMGFPVNLFYSMLTEILIP